MTVLKISDIERPYIKCPEDGLLTYTLPPGRNHLYIQVPKPETNVDWLRYIFFEIFIIHQFYINFHIFKIVK